MDAFKGNFESLQNQIFNGEKYFNFYALVIGIQLFSEKYNKLILYDNKYQSNIFLLNFNQNISVGTTIIIKSIIIQEINNSLYCIIEEYINKKEIPNPKIKEFLNSKVFHLFQIKKCNSLKELKNENNNTLISIDLRVNVF